MPFSLTAQYFQGKEVQSGFQIFIFFNFISIV